MHSGQGTQQHTRHKNSKVLTTSWNFSLTTYEMRSNKRTSQRCVLCAYLTLPSRPLSVSVLGYSTVLNYSFCVSSTLLMSAFCAMYILNFLILNCTSDFLLTQDHCTRSTTHVNHEHTHTHKHTSCMFHKPCRPTRSNQMSLRYTLCLNDWGWQGMQALDRSN
jgi:hypothetical protein